MTGKLPKDGSKLYDKVFKKAKSYYGGDEENASKVAWSVVKKQYKKVGDNWEKRAHVDSWKYQNVSPKEVLASAEVTKETLLDAIGEGDNLSKLAEIDDDMKMAICVSVDSKDSDILRKIAESDAVYNKILLDKHKKSVIK